MKHLKPVTVSTKGQITVPKAVIARYGFKRGDTFQIEVVDEDTLRFTPVNRANRP